MARKPQSSHLAQTMRPNTSITEEGSYRDNLDRVVHIIDLLKELDLSEGLTPSARAGLYWIHRMLADAVKRVSNGLK